MVYIFQSPFFWDYGEISQNVITNMRRQNVTVGPCWYREFFNIKVDLVFNHTGNINDWLEISCNEHPVSDLSLVTGLYKENLVSPFSTLVMSYIKAILDKQWTQWWMNKHNIPSL